MQYCIEWCFLQHVTGGRSLCLAESFCGGADKQGLHNQLAGCPLLDSALHGLENLKRHLHAVLCVSGWRPHWEDQQWVTSAHGNAAVCAVRICFWNEPSARVWRILGQAVCDGGNDLDSCLFYDKVASIFKHASIIHICLSSCFMCIELACEHIKLYA